MKIPYLLTLITYLPAVGGLLLLLMKDSENRIVRWFAFLLSLFVFLLSWSMLSFFSSATSGFALEESIGWVSVPQLGISHRLGVDGLNLFLVLLTTFLSPIAILSSFRCIDRRVRFYYSCLLLLETGMIGVFLATDMILFYVFWEVMLIPMYLLIGVWGGERRVYAAVKFILFTMVGSLLMLVGILYLYVHVGIDSFDYRLIAGRLSSGAGGLSRNEEAWLFLAFFVAFAIKVPLFPFHTWLPDAHVEAPTAGSVILAGVMLKMGTYGLLRFAFPLFPDDAVTFAPYLAALAVIGIVYGALVAMVQPDMKKLVAYSSVSHLGFVVLGICAMNLQGLQGAVYQMLNHGVSTGALFLIVGMLSERRHTRLIGEFGGLKAVMPRLVAVFLVFFWLPVGGTRHWWAFRFFRLLDRKSTRLNSSHSTSSRMPSSA
jgi:NADH-quinone oxidoreductase subunit M